jgi:hypothetical protein
MHRYGNNLRKTGNSLPLVSTAELAGNMIGVHNVETRIDLAYASLYVDAALLGAVLSLIIRLAYK